MRLFILHKKLEIKQSEQELSYALYDELSWQPKDQESLQCIIKKCPSTCTGITLLETLSGNMDLGKWIYSMRNRIVHETRDAMIPLDQDENWATAIAGLIYIIKEI